ncbi:allergen Asp f 15 [Cladorrhinum sp. PSN259]|nr:allergen Asp f 15 [Cladorrhinum sp. PSN259]
MRLIIHFFFLLLAAITARAAKGTAWVTPHESYSSSVGVLGCKVNTNRIAYWPGSVDCNNLCIKLSYEGRSVKLLRIDQSQGAYDVSYDAWNYLYSGFPATEKPTAGGATAMEYEELDASACSELIHTKGSKLPLSAANSMNFLASCLEKDTWVGKNHILYNILDPICSWGYDEACTLDWPTANQAKCPHQLGTPSALTSAPVYNIQYTTGKKVSASTGQVVASGGESVALHAKNAANRALGGPLGLATAMALSTFLFLGRI